jgi:Glycosyltransferase (GlcNAc)
MAVSSEEDLIFVSIAAYRDPQLVRTIESCIAQAAHPQRLRFGICRQHGEDEPALAYAADARFRILDVPWQQSEGVCWARAEIMKTWAGEQWFLQLDSHCRLAPAWDTQLIRWGEDSAKAVISTYASAFTPGEHEVLEGDPLQVVFRNFTEDGIPCLKPVPIAGWRAMSRPLRARFVSAGFLFARSTLIQDVPYDPELYFLGEEIALSLRAFTSGYDLLHPCRTVAWHHYRRAESPKHWTDHVSANGVRTAWQDLDRRSKQTVKQILGGSYQGRFGLGSARTLEEYEAYAGLNFRLRRAHGETVRGAEPPTAQAANWAEELRTWKVRFTLERSALPAEAFSNPAFWYVGIHDSHGKEIDRRDLSSSEIKEADASRQEVVVERRFESASEPATWTVWPKTTSGWLQKKVGILDEHSRWALPS